MQSVRYKSSLLACARTAARASGLFGAFPTVVVLPSYFSGEVRLRLLRRVAIWDEPEASFATLRLPRRLQSCG